MLWKLLKFDIRDTQYKGTLCLPLAVRRGPALLRLPQRAPMSENPFRPGEGPDGEVTAPFGYYAMSRITLRILCFIAPTPKIDTTTLLVLPTKTGRFSLLPTRIVSLGNLAPLNYFFIKRIRGVDWTSYLYTHACTGVVYREDGFGMLLTFRILALVNAREGLTPTKAVHRIQIRFRPG